MWLKIRIIGFTGYFLVTARPYIGYYSEGLMCLHLEQEFKAGTVEKISSTIGPLAGIKPTHTPEPRHRK